MRLVVFARAALALAIAVAPDVSACSGPSKGHFDSFEQLISETKSIVLATFSCEPMNQDTPDCAFQIVEVLKDLHGSSPASANSSRVEMPNQWRRFALRSLAEKRPQNWNDFEAHTAVEFWDRTASRAEFPDGAYTPDFGFIPGQDYLLFLDSPASMYASELILLPNDLWLIFVRGQVKNVPD